MKWHLALQTIMLRWTCSQKLRPNQLAGTTRQHPDSSSGPGVVQGGWNVQIYPSAHQIIRVACYRQKGSKAINEEPHKEPGEVIWPTWPATIEDEAEVTTSPLADLQRYWTTAGNRLRESAKWMATVLGAALGSVVGTSPISGHSFQVVAALIGLAGLSCLGFTMILVLRVMLSM
jgi:hypothetical protein